MSDGGQRPTFSRDELVGGMPARRATTLLFAIEGRSARLVERSRTAMATYLTERAEADREHAFLDALAGGRQPVRVTIQDLERFATDWASLVPPDADLQAVLAGLLGEKYRFRASDVPRIRAALSLDYSAVEAAFQRRRDRPLASIYAASVTLADQIRWRRARLAAALEDLPPFWMAFALTLTETVGAGILALPIAFAAVGPAAALALLVAFGLVNVLTVAALVEAITRDGTMRYGSAYFGRFVGQYLGRPGSFVVTVALLLLNGIGLVALMIGFGSALAGVSGLPAGLWAALLAVAILVILRRESLDATVASVLLVGGVNIAILIAISVAALGSLDPATLSSAAGAESGSVVGLVFGTALMAYFGHTSAGNAAKVVLRRDPGGRALLWGNVAALLVAMGLYLLTVVAILGAVPASELVGYDGTALTPLVAQTGPVVAVLGSIFVILAMGLTSLHISLGLYNQVGEWLPPVDGAAPGKRPLIAARSRKVQALIKALPVVALLGLLEILLLTGTGSFTGSLSFLGTVTVPLLGGLFPMLLLLAGRRRGEYVPATVLRAIGHPLSVVLVSALFLAGLLAHAVVIWEQPLERASALAAAAAFVVVAVWSVWRRAFRRRTVVELRVDAGPPDVGSIGVVIGGQTVPVLVHWGRFDGTSGETVSPTAIADATTIRSIRLELPSGSAPETRVWSHRVEVDGGSALWPADAAIVRDGARYPLLLDADGLAAGDAGPGPSTVVIERSLPRGRSDA